MPETGEWAAELMGMSEYDSEEQDWYWRSEDRKAESCAPAVLLGQIGTDDVGKTLRL